ncbi:MAG: acyl-CoA dehydrogenase family protein, partial [Planctomycetes bacterium]|nr:acyl-CoA dehydrogenase family protein [Planctomycetota bacterium]
MHNERREELRALREAVSRFAVDQVAPHAQEWDREKGFPLEMVAQLGRQGFMGVRVPECYGGAGGDFATFA